MVTLYERVVARGAAYRVNEDATSSFIPATDRYISGIGTNVL